MISQIGNRNRSVFKLTIVDGLFLLIFISLICTSIINSQYHNRYPFVMLEPLLISYSLLRVLFSINSKWTSNLLIVVIMIVCAREIWLSYSQLFQYFGIKNGQEICVGSFSNSGPLGCFFSACSSLFIAVQRKTSKKIILILLMIMTVFASIMLVCTLSRASMLAFAISLLFLFMKKDSFSSFIKKNWASLFFSIILISISAYYLKKPSADGRILMTRINTQMIYNVGLSGVGLGNYEGAYGEAQARFFMNYLDPDADLSDIDQIPERMRMVADCPSYAFNEYLRVGVEAGPIVMFLLVSMLIICIISFYRCDNYWLYPLLSISVFACFSYPYEINALLFFLIVCLASNDSNEVNNITIRYFFSVMMFILIPILVTHISKNNELDIRIKKTAMKDVFKNRHKAYVLYDCGNLPDGLTDEKILYECGVSLNKEGNYAFSDSVLLIGVGISSDPMFWNVMGNNSLAQGKYREAEERYKHAFYMVPNRLYPLYLLAKLYHTEGDTARFVKMADIVESFKPKIESTNTEYLRSEIRNIRTSYQ